MSPAGSADRRRAAVLAGHIGDEAAARESMHDPDPVVRASAIGALGRCGVLDAALCRAFTADEEPEVRRRLAEELGRASAPPDAVDAVLGDLLGDPDAGVAEAAAWAAGEHHGARPDLGGEPAGDHPPPAQILDALRTLAADHDDPLTREAAVAALGAIGTPDALPTLLAATGDRPAVRRRAVIALAAFADHPDARAALTRATEDRDWQVREAAELLLRDESA